MKLLFSKSTPSFFFKLVDLNMISLTNPSQQNYGNSTIGGSEQSVRDAYLSFKQKKILIK